MPFSEFLNLMLAVLTVLVAVLFPRLGNRILRPFRIAWRKLAAHRAICISLVGLIMLLLQLALSWKVGPPVPTVHDEFAYLLTAETFLDGRATNPTPPFVDHFRVPHVVFEPTYQAKYPPAQAVTLAAGQLMFGEPIWGVWLTLAFAAAATTWMLYQWVPPQWALFGGLLAVLNAPLQLLWGYSFMGGGVAMLGGALLFGSLRRVLNSYHIQDAVIMGLGLGILANSRPYEGLLVSLLAAIVLATALLSRNGPGLNKAAFRVVLPLTLLLGITATQIAFYNKTVTGNPLKLPYVQWAENKQADLTTRTLFSTGLGDGSIPWNEIQGKLYNQWAFYGQYLILIPLLFVPSILRNKWAAFAVVSAGIVSLAVALQNTAGHLHYAAPAICLVFVVLTETTRRLNTISWRGRRFGRVMAGLIPISMALVAAVTLMTYAGGQPMMRHWQWAHTRQEISESLDRMPGKHLVMVRYGPRHSPHHEWAYNSGDLASAKVVWAKELAEADNQVLIDHLADRKTWLLEPDNEPVRIVPYSHPTSPKNTIQTTALAH